MNGHRVTLLRGVAAVGALGALLTCAAAEELYVARARDNGAPFDLTLTEIKREPGKSILSVPGFHKRTAAGSRWLICNYNDLAEKRGFKYWTVIYPHAPAEEFPIAFYQSETEDVAKILGSSYVSSNEFPPEPTAVETWKKICSRGK